jgi:hypothetical protein
MTKQEIESRIEVVTAKMAAAYDERDRHVANDSEMLAHVWDMRATNLDLEREQLRNML